MSRRLPVLAALVAVLALLAPPALASGLSTGDTSVPDRMSPGFSRDLAALSPTASYGAFVHVQDGSDAADVLATAAPDLTIIRNYPLVSAAFVSGPIGSIARLASHPSVTYLQDNAKLQYFGDTAPWATRVRVAQEAVAGGPYTDSSGNVLDGRGVGVAVVDAGIFAAHPDLKNRVAKNFKVVCSTPLLISTETESCFGNWVADNTTGSPDVTFGVVDVGDTTSDTSSGHGTHVAGIVAGDGTSSTGTYPAGSGPNVKGTFTGVAPGATLYGYGVGEVISVLWATEAFYHIVSYGHTFSPSIRVVTNSWGDPGGSAYDGNDIINKLVNQMIGKGMTVLFAAGNDGGNGNGDMTSSYCKNPTPGVICVANYDDDTVAGGRNGALDSTSSRGKSGSPTTYPDISAPGTFITSTCLPMLPLCDLGPNPEWAPLYNLMTGTSMATPHVAGAAALMLQASPSLTPALVEDRMQDNAYKFTFGGAYGSDPQNSGGTTSFDKGAGLLNMQATLNAMGVSHGTASAPSNLPIFSGDGGDFSGPGSLDLESLSVTQTATGFRYDLVVSNATDIASGTSTGYTLFQTTNGADYRTNVISTPTGVMAGAPAAAPLVNAAPQNLTRVGNTISFVLPFSTLGNLPAGEPVFRIRAAAQVLAAGQSAPFVESAPSAEPGPVAQIAHPQYGRPYARA